MVKKKGGTGQPHKAVPDTPPVVVKPALTSEQKLKKLLRTAPSQIKCKAKRAEVTEKQKKFKKAAKKERRNERDRIEKELGPNVRCLLTEHAPPSAAFIPARRRLRDKCRGRSTTRVKRTRRWSPLTTKRFVCSDPCQWHRLTPSCAGSGRRGNRRVPEVF